MNVFFFFVCHENFQVKFRSPFLTIHNLTSLWVQDYLMLINAPIQWQLDNEHNIDDDTCHNRFLYYLRHRISNYKMSRHIKDTLYAI